MCSTYGLHSDMRNAYVGLRICLDNDEATDESSEQMQESDTTSQSEECMNDEPSHDSNQCTDDSDQPSANGDRIRLKLKFLSETERIVTAKKTDTIEDIKR